MQNVHRAEYPYKTYQELVKPSNLLILTILLLCGVGASILVIGSYLGLHPLLIALMGLIFAGASIPAFIGVAKAASSGIPIGLIAIWSGLVSEIPTNWHLCDGTSGTVDLQEKFVYGATEDADVGDTGGDTTHTHTVDIWASLRSGSALNCQNCSDVAIIETKGSNNTWENWPGGTDDDTAGKRETTASGSSMPPWYKLAFIQKIA